MGFSRLPPFPVDILDVGLVLDGRIRIGHADHGREAGRHGGSRTTGDRLFLFVSRLAKVNVNINQARRHELAGRIDHPVDRLGDRPVEVTDFRHLAVQNENVAYLVEMVCRVNHPAVFDKHLVCHSAPTLS